MPEAPIDPPQDQERGKGPAGPREKRSKRVRQARGSSILVDPMSLDFDPFAVVEWSPDFVVEHNQAVEASVSGEFNPVQVAARSSMVTLQNLYHNELLS